MEVTQKGAVRTRRPTGRPSTRPSEIPTALPTTQPTLSRQSLFLKVSVPRVVQNYTHNFQAYDAYTEVYGGRSLLAGEFTYLLKFTYLLLNNFNLHVNINTHLYPRIALIFNYSNIIQCDRRLHGVGIVLRRYFYQFAVSAALCS